MKTATTAIITADKNAIAYFNLLSPLQAKKVLFAMTRITGDQRLGDSEVAELRTIAQMYDGFVIQGKAIKELAANLAKAYAEKHPHVLLNRKSMAQYADARYRKLLEAVGDYGFDFVLEALRQGKAYVANPVNNIDEKQMLRAMRWQERREGQDAESSNLYHRKKGLKLAGLDDMAELLVEHSFTIANVYEMVEPAASGNFLKPAGDIVSEDVVDNQEHVLNVREMKMHFLERADLLENFYGTHAPELPQGYSEAEIEPIIIDFARKGLLKDSEEVLKYVDLQQRYELLMDQLKNEFCSAELDLIFGESDKVKALIANAW